MVAAGAGLLRRDELAMRLGLRMAEGAVDLLLDEVAFMGELEPENTRGDLFDPRMAAQAEIRRG
jgi:hypothetical protein